MLNGTLIAAVVLAGVLWLLQLRFIALMHRLEPEAWRFAVGPDWLRFNSLTVVKFVQLGHYHQLPSPRLRAFAATLRVLQYAELALLALSLVFYLLA